MTDAGFALGNEVDAARLPQLMDVFASGWWTKGRLLADVQAMLDGSDLVFTVLDRSSDRLVGFARVLTDFKYLAMILDVIVAEDFRQAGLGAMLLDAVVNHPRLKHVHSVELVCQPALTPFYKRFGFTDRVGTSRLMRRTLDSALLSSGEM